MSSQLREWWKSIDKSEKSGLLVLGVFAAGIFLFMSGIWIGQAFGKVVS